MTQLSFPFWPDNTPFNREERYLMTNDQLLTHQPSQKTESILRNSAMRSEATKGTGKRTLASDGKPIVDKPASKMTHQEAAVARAKQALEDMPPKPSGRYVSPLDRDYTPVDKAKKVAETAIRNKSQIHQEQAEGLKQAPLGRGGAKGPQMDQDLRQVAPRKAADYFKNKRQFD